MCTEDDYSFVFGACDESTNTRQVAAYWRPPALCDPNSTTLPKAFTVPCNTTCEHGFFNVDTGACEACPPGSVPFDAARSYSSWYNELPTQMRTSCTARDGSSNCQPWSLHGEYIDSGDSSEGATSTLEYTFVAQDNGWLYVEHMAEGQRIAAMCSIILDGQSVFKKSGSWSWDTFSQEFEPGVHTVQFVFKNQFNFWPWSSSKSRYAIRSIKVTGLAPFALKCTKCEPGYAQSDATKEECFACLPVCSRLGHSSTAVSVFCHAVCLVA